jgi:hypothetical protein
MGKHANQNLYFELTNRKEISLKEGINLLLATS